MAAGSDTIDEPQAKKVKIATKFDKEIDYETKLLINDKFMVSMPEDFYDFWQFLYDLDSENPSHPLSFCHLR